MARVPTPGERMMKVQEVLLRAVHRELSWIQAAEIIGCTTRSLRRWKLRFEKFGVHGLLEVHVRRHLDRTHSIWRGPQCWGRFDPNGRAIPTLSTSSGQAA